MHEYVTNELASILFLICMLLLCREYIKYYIHARLLSCTSKYIYWPQAHLLRMHRVMHISTSQLHPLFRTAGLHPLDHWQIIMIMKEKTELRKFIVTKQHHKYIAAHSL
jgi:hypothetical protein